MAVSAEHMVPTGVTVHDEVVRASAHTYARAGVEVIISEALHDSTTETGHPDDSYPDILVPALRRVEEVETGETLDAVDAPRLERFRSAGYQVWILVPLTDIGFAHRRLRGRVDRIQPWWFDGTAFRFGEDRVP